MSPALDLGDLDRFTVGTEGPVGQRVFLLQCHRGSSLLTLKAEKQQVSVLAEYLGRLLADLEAPGELPEAPEPDHAADALAAAFCHLNYARSPGKCWGKERQ